MKMEPNGPTITLDLPVRDERLFGSETIDDVLLFLSRHPDDAFSITDLANAVGYSRPSVTKAVDVLSSTELVVTERDGARRMVCINRDRLHVPDDAYFQIPQSEFHAPVKAAAETVVDELESVIAVVLYGSVARGDADRRSDIDLWVLVLDDRMENQRRANRVRQRLENEAFDGSRYEYEIDVEALGAVPNYRTELRDVLSDGIAVYETDEFETVRNMVLQGTGESDA
ncbi:nucleotidyltransferase domain-containing protein [Natrinema zhouii]|uniref:MarR family transcriptional regulator n=1 Tax=Natrinema zhouii TaxID=1710539 RepID=A0A7D6CQ18_9EURY|nr:nucleotidyltransferase domain-containing protein [Natrinema zhouii]QLK25330.1 nucleotidyltransferase domain-containing protein [Natrinema zhouii]